MESASHKNVVELCEHLSTIHHPLQIELVPVEDHVAWLDWQPTITSLPAWVRIKQSSILRQFMADPTLLKYTGDLAWVKLQDNYEATICLVLRLHVKVEREGKKPLIKWLPRLFHPKAIGELQETVDIAHRMDPNVRWRPDCPHELESVEPGIHRLAKDKKAGDLSLPFAVETMLRRPSCAQRSAKGHDGRLGRGCWARVRDDQSGRALSEHRWAGWDRRNSTQQGAGYD